MVSKCVFPTVRHGGGGVMMLCWWHCWWLFQIFLFFDNRTMILHLHSLVHHPLSNRLVLCIWPLATGIRWLRYHCQPSLCSRIGPVQLIARANPSLCLASRRSCWRWIKLSRSTRHEACLTSTSRLRTDCSCKKKNNTVLQQITSRITITKLN